MAGKWEGGRGGGVKGVNERGGAGAVSLLVIDVQVFLSSLDLLL